MSPHDEPTRLLPPEERYWMRRLTDEEMARICYTAASDVRGAAKALEMLWRLILGYCEALSGIPAAARPGGHRVENYAIAADQSQTIYKAMITRPDLPPKLVNGIAMLWLDQGPGVYSEHDEP